MKLLLAKSAPKENISTAQVPASVSFVVGANIKPTVDRRDAISARGAKWASGHKIVQCIVAIVLEGISNIREAK